MNAPNGMVWAPLSEYQANVPDKAVRAGFQDGRIVWVARAFHEGEYLPAKLVENDPCAYVCWGGDEHRKQHYEVLVLNGGMVAWVPASHGFIPTRAISTGTSQTNERMFIGRVFHDGQITLGKVHQSHGVCYIPFSGQELAYQEYEVLVEYFL